MPGSKKRPMLRLFGIDPGAAHVGWCRLLVLDGMYTADMGVVNVKDLHIRDQIMNVYSAVEGLSITVIAESYQQRPVGFNRFGRGDTLRLLGALQYAASLRGYGWCEVAPGDATKELPRLHIGKYLDRWAKWVPTPGSPDWGHAHSAWRVVARHMLSCGMPELSALKDKTLPPLSFDHTVIRTSRTYLRAPSASWTI